METHTHRALIVDDHALIRRGLVSLFSETDSLDVCGEAADIPTAMSLLEEARPDLVIVDLRLGEASGLDLIKRISQKLPSVKIVVSSMRDERVFAMRSLQAGAHGYVSKDEPEEELVAAIHKVLGGEIALSEPMTREMLRSAVRGNEDEVATPEAQLSDRELEVFQLLGRGVTSREIAESLHLSIKTIETYREKIKAKLGLKNASELTHYATQWMLEEGC